MNTFTIETTHMLNRFAVQAERSLEQVNECVRLHMLRRAALTHATRALCQAAGGL